MRSLEHGFIRSICRPSYSYQAIFQKVYDGAKVREKQLLIVQYRTLYLTPFLHYVLRKR